MTLKGATHDVLVVVPAHNEAEVLGGVLSELSACFRNVLCIDDGSSDETSNVARQTGAAVVRHEVNLGQGAALQTGFSYALGRPEISYVVTFDGDGQHRVVDAVTMVAMARSDALDVILGSRNLGSTVAQPRRRKLVLRMALMLSRRMSKLALSDTHNGLRVLSRAALAEIRLTHPGMAYASELEVQVARSTLPWAECPIAVTYSDYSRAKGQSDLNAINIVYDLFSARLRGAA